MVAYSTVPAPKKRQQQQQQQPQVYQSLQLLFSSSWLPTRHIMALLLLLLLLVTLFTKARVLHSSQRLSTSTKTRSLNLNLNLNRRLGGNQLPTKCDEFVLTEQLHINLQPVEHIDRLLLVDNPKLMETTGKNRNLLTPLVFKRYIERHVRSVHCLLTNNNTNDSACAQYQANAPRFIIWQCETKLCGGIGDRMRGIKLAFLMAVLTDRLFFINWPTSIVAPFDLTAALPPAYFDWRYSTFTSVVRALTLARNNSHALNSSFFYFPTHEEVYVKRQYSFNVSSDLEKDMDETTVQWDMKLAYNSTMTNFQSLFSAIDMAYVSNRLIARSALLNITENIHHFTNDQADSHPLHEIQRHVNDQVGLERRIMRVLFRVSALVQDAVRLRTPDWERFTRYKNNVTYIGVHVRMGDDAGETDTLRLKTLQQHREETAKRLFQCSTIVHDFLHRHRLRKGQDIPHMHVFVASDSQQFKIRFEKLAAQQSQRKVELFTSDTSRKVLHIDRAGVAQDHLDVADKHTLCDAFVDVFADLVALANSSAMIFFHSGYPSTALAMSTSNRWRELNPLDKPPYALDECVFGKKPLPGMSAVRKSSTGVSVSIDTSRTRNFETMYG